MEHDVQHRPTDRERTAQDDWIANAVPHVPTGTRGSNRWRRRAALMLSDVLAMSAAAILAIVASDGLRSLLLGMGGAPSIPASPFMQIIMFELPVALLLFVSSHKGHYTRLKPLRQEFGDLLAIVGYAIAVTAVVLYLTDAHFSRLWFVSYWALILLLVPGLRYLTKRYLIRTGRFFVPVVVYGTGVNALKCARGIAKERMLGLEVVAFVSTGSLGAVARSPDIPRAMVLDPGHDRSLLDVRYDRPHLLFALDSADEFDNNRAVLNQLIATSRYVTVAPPIYGLPLDGAEVLNVQPFDSLLIRLQNNLAKPHCAFLKRALDIVGAAALIVAIAPLVLVLVLLIKRDGGPAFYRQRRIGRNATTFHCWKFRSMVVDGDRVLAEHLAVDCAARAEWARDQKLRDDPRVTGVGRIIRKGSLDELPQLWNVLRGDMSLVGPRPIVVDEQSKYGDLLRYYLRNRPGITGLWQISGRNDTTYEERVELDVWYSRNWSPWLDFTIIARTLPAVFSRSGAY